MFRNRRNDIYAISQVTFPTCYFMINMRTYFTLMIYLLVMGGTMFDFRSFKTKNSLFKYEEIRLKFEKWLFQSVR